MFNLCIIISNFIIIVFSLSIIFINYSFCWLIEIQNIHINININFLSLWFIYFMSLIIYFLIFLLSSKIVSYTNYFFVIISYIFIFSDVILIILVDDFACFMILFESLFFPICFVSLFFNFNNSFIFAIFYLVIFSSISSIMCIIVCIIIIFHFNILSLQHFIDICFFDSLYLIVFIWMMLFVMFAINYPIWPLHIWLPELHVEVNTEMSVLLASIVLNIGFFGIFNFLFLCFINISLWFIGIVDCFIILGLLFLSLMLIFIIDYNKIVANWSVIHTGIGLVLLWHNDILFTAILLFCNMSHILSSAFMFIIIGYMYDNYGISVFLVMVSFFGISIWSSLFLGIFLFNIDFPFMLLFYIDIFVLYGLISLSYMYIIYFYIVVLTIFVSSLYIYMCLSFYSFIWLDNYMSIDLSLNDVYMYILIFFILSAFFYLIYLLF